MADSSPWRHARSAARSLGAGLRAATPAAALAATLAAALAATLVGCGGGGSSGAAARIAPVAPTPAAPSPSPSPQALGGFETGTFEPSREYAAICATPRAGIDPRTGRAWPDVRGTSVDENTWLRSWSNELYLWFDEIEDVDPRSLGTPAYFDVMKTFETTASGAPKDRFHFSQSTDAFRAFSQSGVAADYGARLALVAPRPPREVRVAFVQAGSPAAAAGLARGAEIVGVDGVDVRFATSEADVDTLNAALFPSDVGETHVLEVIDPGQTEARSIDLTSVNLVLDPVPEVRIVDTATGPVGYVAFHDHIATAEGALVDAVRTLVAGDVVDVVLDLRYNGGGLLAIAGQLGFMVAGPAAASGRVFEALEFNAKHRTFNPVTGARLEPDLFPSTTQGFSRPAGEALPSLDLERVFVLTSAETCSASESFVNGLRGIGVEVIQIGEGTCGKPFGFYPTDNCGTTWFSIQFRGVNAQEWGDYADGFRPGAPAGPAGIMPGCIVADDFTRALGDPLEARLATALAWRKSSACPSAPAAASDDVRVRVGPGGDGSPSDGPPLRRPPLRGGAWKTP